ncbi:MAG: LPS assembly protein LptD [Alphaproteobacteria bacterium]|nr:LPS assembly protein LptD [Alphaproteobacteria bacterium]
MLSGFQKSAAFGLFLLALCCVHGTIAAAPLGAGDAPVHFQAVRLLHDDDAQTVTALGDVEFIQGAKILRAEKMVYHLDTDVVQAIGNVSLLDEDGSVYFSEYVELAKDMRDGFIQGLLSHLADGSRFTAAEARRTDGTRTEMHEASYTACHVCETNPNPIWQFKADKVVHDEKNKNIEYKNARLEVFGVPLAWSPVFSHADPSVKRRSGFLRPRFGWSDSIGTFAEGGYYFDIAKNKDATLSVRPTTRKGVLTQGQWRQRFENGRLEVNGSFAQSDRVEEDGRIEDDRVRAHLSANGLFDLNEKWRAGFDLNRASDKGYLRLYDIDRSNILHNDIYAERFSGRDYSRISVQNVQDVRLGVRPVQPDILPIAEHHMLGEPQSLLGGRWSLDVMGAHLQRPASGQDTQRANGSIGWQRRDVHAPTGLVATTAAGAAGDLYAVQNNAAASGTNTESARGHGFASVTASYPLVKPLERAELMAEPLVGIGASTRVNNTPADFPDEDSIDVRIDANNLFANNRFPGYDRHEDGVRVSYGMKGGYYAHDGRYARAFVGQSYRFNDNDGLFPQGSGLERHASDFVGQFGIGNGDWISADYRIQLDSETLAAHRHELQAQGKIDDKLKLDTRFIYLDAIAGTGFIEPREQWQLGGTYAFTENWSMTSGTLMDFGAEPGLRRASLMLSYADECFSFSAQGVRNLISDASGESGTLVLLRVGLKNIGEFQTPEITVKSEEGP